MQNFFSDNNQQCVFTDNPNPSAFRVVPKSYEKTQDVETTPKRDSHPNVTFDPRLIRQFFPKPFTNDKPKTESARGHMHTFRDFIDLHDITSDKMRLHYFKLSTAGEVRFWISDAE